MPMGTPRTAAGTRMLRANNSNIDFGALNNRLRSAASRLRDSSIIEERRRERAGERETSPRMALARYRAVNAFLDRAEDLNQPRTRLPRRFAKLYLFGQRPGLFVVRLFNFAFRPQRDVNQAQTQAVRELSQATLLATRRILQLEREIERLRNLLERKSDAQK